jgi:riboflavin synthase
MFTGIITDIGKIAKLETHSSGQKITIQTAYDVSQIALGASIACNGACLTVIENISQKIDNQPQNFFVVDLSNETVQKTIFQFAKQGDELNLERALKLGDELGGHYVTGHVDCLAEVTKINIDAGAADLANWQIYFKTPANFAKFIAAKGSVTINGVALTVNGFEGQGEDEAFWVNIIPHTLKHTNLYNLKAGSMVNFEIDLIARYLERLNIKS